MSFALFEGLKNKMITYEKEPQIARGYDRELRLHNDMTTWLAETLDGSMRTQFDYWFDGKELYAEDSSGLKEVFEDALDEAKNLPDDLSFEVRRRNYELEEYADMLEMAKGNLPNTMIVISDFPHELMHYTKDVGGYNVTRKQTMLRVITKTKDGQIKMVSQSLDGSNRQALDGLYDYLGVEAPKDGELLPQRIFVELDSVSQEFLPDNLTRQYDLSLEGQTGKKHYAGIAGEKKRDTYDFVRDQQDLLDFFTREVETISDDDELRYYVAAAIAERYAQKTIELSSSYVNRSLTHAEHIAHQLALAIAVGQAGQRALNSGKTFSGCGGSLSGAKKEMNALGYGNQSQENNNSDDDDMDSDSYGPLEFVCSNGHRNRRPRGKLIDCKVKGCKGASC